MLLAGYYASADAQENRQALLGHYKGDVPDALLTAYVKFVQSVRNPEPKDLLSHCLPQSVTVSVDNRKAGFEEYGNDLNLPFLKSTFRPQIWSVIKENDDSYLIRTATSALRFVN